MIDRVAYLLARLLAAKPIREGMGYACTLVNKLLSFSILLCRSMTCFAGAGPGLD
jgi:hypothetical protein